MKSIVAVATVAIAVAAAVTVGCGRAERASEAPVEPPVRSSFLVVGRAPVVDRYEATGTVASKTVTVVASKVMGQVTAIHVREGDRVAPGQLLVEIEARDASAGVARAKAGVSESQHGLDEVDRAIDAAVQEQAAAAAGLDLARVTRDRYAKLLDARSASRQEYDEAEARFRTAAAQFESAKSNVEVIRARRSQAAARIDAARAESQSASVALGYARIVAPSAAVVTARQVEVGSMATPGAPLLTLEDASQYRLEAAVEESYASRVKVGATVPVRVDAVGALELSGTVAEVMPSADAGSRSVVVKIDLPANPTLRSGMYGSALFPTGERVAIAIPSAAVIRRGQLTGVWVVDSKGAARLRVVTLGAQSGESVEVLSGLDEGERLLTSNLDRVGEGRTVVAD